MQRRTWLLIAAAAIILMLAGAHACTRPRGDSDEPSRSDASAGQAAAPAAGADIEAEKLRERIRRHDEAVYAAVATLQRYLAALGGDDRSRADAFWAGKRPPADASEADLRSLRDLRGLRIENGKPKALDSEAVPQALEIPVELRASFAHGPLRRYHGWYRLRRSVVDGGWEITSASIDAVEQPE